MFAPGEMREIFALLFFLDYVAHDLAHPNMHQSFPGRLEDIPNYCYVVANLLNLDVI